MHWLPQILLLLQRNWSPQHYRFRASTMTSCCRASPSVQTGSIIDIFFPCPVLRLVRLCSGIPRQKVTFYLAPKPLDYLGPHTPVGVQCIPFLLLPPFASSSTIWMAGSKVCLQDQQDPASPSSSVLLYAPYLSL